MPNTNIIELNGKRYDALSGQFLGDSAAVVAKSRTVNPANSHHAGKALDGVLRSPQAANTPQPILTKATPSAPAQATHIKPVMDISRPAPHHTSAHQVQHSKTLMRHVVHKPDTSLKRQVKALTRTDILAKQPGTLVAPKLSYNNVNKLRQEHARQIPQSQLVSKFAPAAISPVRPSAAYMAAAPVRRPAVQSAAAPAPRSKPSMDIFEQAIASAKSHEQQPVKAIKHGKNKRHRTFSLVAISLVVLGLAGIFAYQNKANIEVRIASMRAGFHIALPNYKSVGFNFSNVHAKPGLADVSFIGPTTANDMTITQQQSTWNSETLLSNFVTPHADSYKTYQSGGRTIYIFGSNATWVDNGVWYQLSGHNLSSSQLLKLASST